MPKNSNSQNSRTHLRLPELVGFYLTLFILYTLLPSPLQAFKPVLSGLLLATLAIIGWLSVLKLKRQ